MKTHLNQQLFDPIKLLYWCSHYCIHCLYSSMHVYSLCVAARQSVQAQCVCTLVCVSHLDFSVNAAYLQRTLGHRAQLGREMRHSWG